MWGGSTNLLHTHISFSNGLFFWSMEGKKRREEKKVEIILVEIVIIWKWQYVGITSIKA